MEYRDDDDDRFLYGDSNDTEEVPKPAVAPSGEELPMLLVGQVV